MAAADVVGVDASTLVPASGAGLLIVTLASYLLKELVAVRAETRQRVVDAQERAKAAEERADAFQKELDVERSKRRDAETAAAITSAQLLAQQQVMDRWGGGPRPIEGSGYPPAAISPIRPPEVGNDR